MTGAFGFPIFVEVRGQAVVVAGDHPEARSKAGALAGLGADVRRWVPADAPWDPVLLDGARLAIVATDDRELDARIAADARAAGVLVNTVDDVANCDWSAPAVLRQGDLTIAVATGGVAPALAVRLRDRFAAEVGPAYGALLEILSEVRPRISASGKPFAQRRSLWYRLVDGPALTSLHAGRGDEARRAIVEAIDEWERAT